MSSRTDRCRASGSRAHGAKGVPQSESVCTVTPALRAVDDSCALVGWELIGHRADLAVLSTAAGLGVSPA